MNQNCSIILIGFIINFNLSMLFINKSLLSLILHTTLLCKVFKKQIAAYRHCPRGLCKEVGICDVKSASCVYDTHLLMEGWGRERSRPSFLPQLHSLSFKEDKFSYGLS